MDTSPAVAEPRLAKNGGAVTSPDCKQAPETGPSAELSDDLSICDPAPRLEQDSCSVAVDALYAEYVRRVEANEPVEPEEFLAACPPAIQAELRRVVLSYEWLRSHHLPKDQPRQINWPRTGETIDGLEIRQVLGHGGFARVYLVWDANLNRHDVLKMTDSSLAEARLAGPLAHPNIIPIQNARTFPDGTSLIRMPLAGCATLASVLNEVFQSNGTMPKRANVFWAVGRGRAARYQIPTPATPAPSDVRSYLEGALALATELASGVAFLHQHDIRHGDLKPSNVLLSWDGRPIILDFNLASRAIVRLPHVGGTMTYMAPEQLQAMVRKERGALFDKKADVFSLGVLLYELFSGQHPFGVPLNRRRRATGDPNEDLRFAQWLLGQQQSPCLPLTDFVPDLDPAVAELVQRCLAFDLRNRPTAAEVFATLQRLSGPARTMGRRLWCNRWWATAAAALLAVQIGLGVMGSRDREPDEVRIVAEAKKALNSGRAAKAESMIDPLVQHEKADATAFFVRGLARMRQKQYTSAASDFEKAYEAGHDPRTLACLTFCYGRAAAEFDCIDRADKAEALGFQSAAVLANRAFATIRTAPEDPTRRRAAFDRARRDVDRAIELDPNLPSAYFVRAFLIVRRYHNWKETDGLKLAELDLDTAISLGPPAAELFQYAAMIRALNPEKTPERETQILDFIGKALAHGANPESFRVPPHFAFVRKNPAFEAILKTAAVQPNENTVRWSDPLPGKFN
jgi:serine/threonine protein kinase